MKYVEDKLVKLNKVIRLQEQQIGKLKEYKSILVNSTVNDKIKVA